MVYTFGITGFLNVFHRPVFQKKKKRLGNWICFRPQARAWETPTLFFSVRKSQLQSLCLFLKDPIELVFSILWPEEGNRSSFRNVVFFGIPDDGQCPKTQ
jgi:hypothetical protein